MPLDLLLRDTIHKIAAIMSEYDPDCDSREVCDGDITTITIDVIMEQGKVTITYPCFQYDSRVYDAGADSVQIFYDYIGQ